MTGNAAGAAPGGGDIVEALLGHARLGPFAVHPGGREVVYATGGGLVRLPLRGSQPGGAGRAAPFAALTGVYDLAFRPDGRRLLASVDPDGRENYRLVEVDPATGATEPLTPAGFRHEFGPPHGAVVQPYGPDSTLLAYASNQRDATAFDIVVRDVATGATRTVYEADDRHYPTCWSPDGRTLLVLRRHQNTEHALVACDAVSGESREVSPGVAKWVPAGWSADGAGVYVATDHGRDRLGVAYLAVTGPARGTLEWIAADPDADVEMLALSPDRRRLAWGVNPDGYTRLHVTDLGTGERRAIRSLPRGVGGRELSLGRQVPRFADATTLVLSLSMPTAPPDLYTVDTAADRTRRLTDHGAGVTPAGLVAPERVTFTGGDGIRVPAFLYRPPGASAEHPAPAVLVIHGGPESAHYPDYEPQVQTLLHRGVAVLAPNIRGSHGNGTAYQRLIYRDWGGGDIDDLAAAVELLRGLSWVDGRRLGVFGGSYGGFATLSCLVRMPAAFSAAVDLFGSADLVASATGGPPHWRRRRRAWVGDVDDPEDLARLRDRSPITHADRIRTPLLMVHGTHDARVAVEHSNRMADRLRALGRPVELLVLPAQGHLGFDAATGVRVARAVTDWFVRHLAPGTPGPGR